VFTFLQILRRLVLNAWQRHYNRSRLHMALGPGVPDLPYHSSALTPVHSRHRLGEHLAVRVKSVLGGIHHEYSLEPEPV
jgi:putative transposase